MVSALVASTKLRRARLVLGLVTPFDKYTIPLSLAVPPCVCAMSTGDGFSHHRRRNGEFCVAVGADQCRGPALAKERHGADSTVSFVSICVVDSTVSTCICASNRTVPKVRCHSRINVPLTDRTVLIVICQPYFLCCLQNCANVYSVYLPLLELCRL